MKNCFLIIQWIILISILQAQISLAQEHQFKWISQTPITDNNPNTKLEVRADTTLNLGFEVKPNNYEGELDKIIVKFRKDNEHLLPKRMQLRIIYEHTGITEDGEYTDLVIFLDTIVPVKENTLIYQYNDKNKLTEANLIVKFYPNKNYSEKYWIEDIFITRKNFQIYEEPDEKPVIYLYPEETTIVSVKHLNSEKFTFSYPNYQQGWNFKVYPSGEIEDKTAKRYPYLFWEGLSDIKASNKMGYCVHKDSMVTFLEDKLSYQGLNDKEITDFITYWAPRMQEFPYYFIYFANQEFEKEYPVQVNPKPDSQIRIFMVAKPLLYPEKIKGQPLQKLERKGFTYVEWGGKLIH